MLNMLDYIPETILLITSLLCSLFLTKKDISHKSVRTMNVIFIVGIIACAGSIIEGSIAHQQLLIRDIFKFYFLLTATYYLFTYSKRFHALERLCILTACIGLFIIVSTTDTFILLLAFVLCISSVYGIALTRERPSKDTVTLASLLLIISILYGLNPFISSMVLLISTVLFYLRTTNKDLEAFCVTFLIPINIYILLRLLLTTQ